MPPGDYSGRRRDLQRGPRIVGAALCASLALSACGGGGLSKEEFVDQADEICAEAQERAEDLAQPTDPSQAASYADSLEEITTGYIAELRELKPPEEDAERLDSLIDMIEQAGLKIVEATRMQATGANPAPVYSEALGLAEDANEEAQKYGFESCGISAVLNDDD